jgi:hypothetical protein
MAIVALVFGAMALAGPANAKDDNPNKPDNPGNSQNAPGHDEDALPPGQDDDFVPPGQSDDKPGMEKITICHFVEGKGETKAGYNIITIALPAWKAHLAHHPGTTDVVYNGVSCPPVTPGTFDFTTASATAQARACTFVNSVWTADYLFTVSAPGQKLTKDTPWTPTEMTDANAAVQSAANGALKTAMDAAQIDYTGVNCLPPGSVTPEAAAAIDAAIAALEPEAVAPVLPATVAEETAAVPAPATVPAAVPAGDGSSVPQVPMALFAALALATVGAVTSALRMATSR